MTIQSTEELDKKIQEDFEDFLMEYPTAFFPEIMIYKSHRVVGTRNKQIITRHGKVHNVSAVGIEVTDSYPGAQPNVKEFRIPEGYEIVGDQVKKKVVMR